MCELDVNGARIKYLDRGQGRPIVFVHGAVADYRVWETQVRTFAASHRVIAYSLRHHFPNHRDGEVTNYNSTVHAEDLAALIQSLGTGPAHLVGHSFGGRIAVLAALRHPESARSLVLAEPSVFSHLPDGPLSEAALAKQHALADNLLELAARHGGPEAAATFLDAMAAPRTFAQFPQRLRDVVIANAHTLRPLLLSRNSEPPDLFQDLKKLRVPMLLVEGELSPQLFKLAVQGIKALLPHAEHVVMRGVAHSLHVEAPRYFNDLLRGFLAAH